MLTPGKLQVNEGSSATLNWNYNLTSSLFSALLQFNGDGIVVISSNGQAGPVSSNFRQRFSVSSTLQSVSLMISKVTTADDKSIGEFSCVLTDLGADKWRRAIQVQVTGKLNTFADFSRFTLLITIMWYYPAFVLWAQWKCNWTFGRQEQFFTLKTSTFLSKN